MIAVDTVEAHPDGRPQHMVELQVPAERDALEAMEERTEAAAPLGVVEIDRIDTRRGQVRRPAFGTAGHVGQPGRVDEPHGRVVGTQRGQLGDARMAQPETREQVRCDGSDRVDHAGTDAVLFEVEREVVVGSALGEEAFERRDVFGELGRRVLGDRPPPPADAELPVVIEHDNAVCGDPHVALQSRRTEPQSERERLDGVLAGMSPRAAVGEQDRFGKQRRETLLHASIMPGICARITPLRRLRVVFNLSGSEIVVILILALVVLGPEKLPDAMRKAGRTFAELKKLSTGFQDEVRKGFEEPVKEVRKTATAVRSAAKAPIDAIASPATAGTDAKQRYNPALDAPPEHDEGSSVADSLPASDDAETSEGSAADPST